MTETRHITFTVNAVAEDGRGSWRGEALNSRSDRRETIASSLQLAQHIQNEIDGMARTDDSAWTRIIEQASRDAA